MANLIDIQNQIEKLQKQAVEIRSRELEATIKDIRLKMQAFGITAADLRNSKRKLSASKKPKVIAGNARTGKTIKKQSISKVAPKFRGPGGETWSGRGLMPRWLSTLVEQGRSKEEFSI